MEYGKAPIDMGHVEPLYYPEYCYVQYLPIKMPGVPGWRSTPKFFCLGPLISKVLPECAADDYLYLTVRHFYMPPGMPVNRPGWHSDGFMSDDMTYLWYDRVPTEFCVQPFALTQDHKHSLREMWAQARNENVVTYPEKHLLRLDQSVIHRVGPNYGGMRLFVKLNRSKSKYALEGNAHNHEFDYNWPLAPRGQTRNDPVTGATS